MLGWPPFNLADVAITLGVIVLALSYVGEADR
jgi:lipoprotein signal peptidase